MIQASEGLAACHNAPPGRRSRFRTAALIARALVILCAGLPACPLRSAPAEDDISAKLKPVPPCAALVTAAQSRQIPLEGIDAPGETNTFNAGDSVTFLVSLHQKGGKLTQWLIYIQALTPNEKELAAKAPKPLVVYDSLGSKMEFQSLPAPVTLRTLGPFTASETKKKPREPQEQNARTSLDRGFLSLGLEPAVATLYRLQQLDQPQIKGFFSTMDTPPAPDLVEKDRKLNAIAKLTPEEERAMCGADPALESYIQIVSQTKGLNDILYQVVDLPSIWSIIRHGGVNADLNVDMKHQQPMELSDWGLAPGAPVYRSPMSLLLNDHLSLKVTLIVTEPRPPLLACAGVVGLLAEKPGDKETYMTLRVISAHKTAK